MFLFEIFDLIVVVGGILDVEDIVDVIEDFVFLGDYLDFAHVVDTWGNK